jgi:hypothetical protein
VKTEYLLGMGALGKKFCLILDIDKVLSTDELLAVSESLADESAADPSVVEKAAKPEHFEAGA